MNTARIQLSKLLDYIGTQIRDAHQKATKADKAVMKFQECELELAIEAEDQGEAGLKVWVIQLGGGSKRTESNTIRVKYTALSEPIVAAVSGEISNITPPKRRSERAK